MSGSMTLLTARPLGDQEMRGPHNNHVRTMDYEKEAKRYTYICSMRHEGMKI